MLAVFLSTLPNSAPSGQFSCSLWQRGDGTRGRGDRRPRRDRSVYQCTEAPSDTSFAGFRGTDPHSSAFFRCFDYCCEAFMRAISVAVIAAMIAIHSSSASAQNFEERWSIIPKAHAEPTPKTDNQTKPEPQPLPSITPQEKRSGSNAARSFSGKASFYSYSGGKTASGSSFNRASLTAAHRSLPFGTRVRVTNLVNQKSVVVVITDRGPRVRNRVLDLSLAAARTLGITDRGIAEVRGEVL
jgi:rare lipoprotein A